VREERLPSFGDNSVPSNELLEDARTAVLAFFLPAGYASIVQGTSSASFCPKSESALRKPLAYFQFIVSLLFVFIIEYPLPCQVLHLHPTIRNDKNYITQTEDSLIPV
jgi:hypothetical protein